MGRADQTLTRLRRLTIEDVGLIERAEIVFDDGLTVFTGETGSGKTMVLGALAFALGARADAGLVRTGAERARVSLEIEAAPALREALATAGIDLAGDDDAIVVRELSPAGRSQARINGVPVSATQVRDLVGTLVDRIGQHEAQRLVEAAYALDIVDRFAGPEALAVRARVGSQHARVRELRGALAAARAAEGNARAQVEFARFALGEIDAAALEADEDERLRARRDVLANAERIAEALAAARDALEDDGGAVDALGVAGTALAGVGRFDPDLAALADAAGALQSEVNDLAARVARAAEAVEANPEEAERVGARLDAIDRLKRKYGATIAEIHRARDAFARAVDDDEHYEERLAALDAERATAEADVRAAAAELGLFRREAAAELERRVAAELRELAMPAARFSVGFEALDEPGPDGAERIEFRFAANPGEPERPLARAASGGELSRVLLALVVALAERRERSALVFDEVDAGIGGAAAQAVGLRLGRLALAGQVIVVTHLAQIASWADTHVVLTKADDGAATRIRTRRVSGAERAAEIARMLSGDATPISLEHAATLLADVEAAR